MSRVVNVHYSGVRWLLVFSRVSAVFRVEAGRRLQSEVDLFVERYHAPGQDDKDSKASVRSFALSSCRDVTWLP